MRLTIPAGTTKVTITCSFVSSMTATFDVKPGDYFELVWPDADDINPPRIPRMPD